MFGKTNLAKLRLPKTFLSTSSDSRHLHTHRKCLAETESSSNDASGSWNELVFWGRLAGLLKLKFQLNRKRSPIDELHLFKIITES